MELGIRGRKALLSGASKGMGKACALEIARAGAELTLVARNEATLLAAAAEIREETGAKVTTVVADITTEEGRAAALSACPEPDILLNNAGGMPPGDFRDWTRDDWIKAVDLMMLPPIFMMQATVDGMMERGFGRIVNIASRSVKIAHAELGLSNGARSGLVGFTAGLARQTVGRNVTINNLLPGIFDSDGQREHVAKLSESTGRPFDEIWAQRASKNPAGRYGRPSEIGAYFAFLVSEHGGFITGQNLLIDGGEYPGTY
ncbi:oxidoreductase [Nitratireductor aestuarii]|uniref:Oxidoreductase n=1 Tax=Nitratireductor aestuarii TaxID=1735103 RepID=A0A916W4Q6_9HYPH|nr:SDR family oxidoreductase [Nitratireductor aestuarii]GGA65978.1 oxidoreductase [Nitratireductor aestuarii]